RILAGDLMRLTQIPDLRFRNPRAASEIRNPRATVEIRNLKVGFEIRNLGG
ncbi:hypothetical protein LCGC14_1817090, partial [marine sediment metagenome]